MEKNNDKMVLSGQTVGKEYQTPELVDLSGTSKVKGGSFGYVCWSGSGDDLSCDSGSLGPA